ncbi:iron ABC transporter permease, partial [Proteus terrae]
WSSVNISWLWFLLPSLLLFRPLTAPKRENRSRHYFDAGFALFGAFIIFPSIAIFIPMFKDSAGNFAPFEFIAILSQAHIVQVMLNS